jgi:hypothetical protein
MNRTFGAVVYSIPILIGTLTLPSSAVTTGPLAGRVTIINANSGLCLTPAGGNRLLNEFLVQFNCDDDPSRFWSFAAVAADIYEITNLNSGLCLAVVNASRSANDLAVQFNCDFDSARRWRLRFIRGNTFQLVNVNSNLCLTVAGGGTDNNVTAVQFPCDGDPSRNWHFGRPRPPRPPSGGGGGGVLQSLESTGRILEELPLPTDDPQ